MQKIEYYFKKNPVKTFFIGFILSLTLLPLILFCVIMILGAVFMGSSSTNDVPQGYKVNDIGACVMTHDFIKDKLISPSSAKFQMCYKVDVKYLDNQIYYMKSYVDSQNAYGAMIRNYYSVIIVDNQDGSWSLKSFKFN